MTQGNRARGRTPAFESTFLRDVHIRIFVHEVDVEGPQVGVQSGVLDRHQVGRGARLVVVAVPEAQRGLERRTRLSVGALAIDDVALAVEPPALQATWPDP